MTQEPLVFGVTVDQIDQLNELLRTITANGDAVMYCNTEYLQPQSVSTLGEGIFNAAVAVGEIVDQIEEQRLPKETGAS